MAARRQASYQWRLREVMAAAGLFNASDLEPLLADRGITLSSVQVWRLVTAECWLRSQRDPGGWGGTTGLEPSPARVNVDLAAAAGDVGSYVFPP